MEDRVVRIMCRCLEPWLPGLFDFIHESLLDSTNAAVEVVFDLNCYVLHLVVLSRMAHGWIV